MIAAGYDNWVGLGIAAVLAMLLLAVLLAPERF